VDMGLPLHPTGGDAIYDLVARNRYRWFGRRDACILPNSDRSWPS
jgi:predicted DCC family thiol-disulfide oxidoreductase YuxK